jgi:hypothetical protein
MIWDMDLNKRKNLFNIKINLIKFNKLIMLQFKN